MHAFLNIRSHRSFLKIEATDDLTLKDRSFTNR